jgi:hypothetical protein
MFSNLRRKYQFRKAQVNKIATVIERLDNDMKSPKINLGQIQAHLNNQRSSINSIHEVEFQIFSQWGDDGIIQYLINKLDIPHKIFVEFGVENYKESNTRFLLINNNWSGLVMDGSQEHIDFIKKDILSWGFDLHAKHAFITKENINSLLSEFIGKGYNKEIGILSVDIDGNDYWIWKEINVVNPVIVITEFNSVFGDEKAWSIPYKSDFYRLDAHKSYQYWGASLKAFCTLAEEKGYYFIGCNSSGNNAYFVRKDKIKDLKPLTCKEGFVESKFREYTDQNGEKVGGKARIELIRNMPVVNIENNQIEKI